MKFLKLSFLSLFLIGTFQFKASAQHEVKTNVLGLLFGAYGLQYEYVTEEMGFLLGFGYFNSNSLTGGDINAYKTFAVTPEFRYYFNPDEDASGFYAGAYLRFRSATGENWASYSDGTGGFIVSDMKNTGLAVGFTTGYKWVARNGLVFESFFGLGRYIVNNYSYDPDIPDNNINNFLFDELPAFDLRFGLGVGYRFGG